MKTTFLGQGFESSPIDAIGNYLIKYLNQQDFHSFTGISAFASEAGIFGLSRHINSAKQNFKNLSLIIGIDQKGTSKEALEEILDLNIDSYIFYQSESPIFHPKIYLFEGDEEVKFILGSSNLTGRGLFTNVESSLLIEFDISDNEGLSLLTALKTYYKPLFDFSDNNLFRISQPVIDDFHARGIVPDEREIRRIYGTKKEWVDSSSAPNANTFTVPKRITAGIPANFPKKPKVGLGASPNHAASEDSTIGELTKEIIPSVSTFKRKAYTLVWESGPLTERDLNIPQGSNTNNTGSMLIKKGLLKEIDQRHYFRDTVFKSLNWIKDNGLHTKHYERAMAKFKIIVAEDDYGFFDLKLSHNTSKKSKSYNQNQPMTSLSWGKAKSIIAKPELIGKNARLFRGHSTGDFILKIE